MYKNPDDVLKREKARRKRKCMYCGKNAYAMLEVGFWKNKYFYACLNPSQECRAKAKEYRKKQNDSKQSS